MKRKSLKRTGLLLALLMLFSLLPAGTLSACGAERLLVHCFRQQSRAL